MCLGKDGGYMQMGGYDKWKHIGDTEEEKELKWMKMLYANADFKVPLRGIMMNDHLIETDKIKRAFIDSGTTFTYVPTNIYNAIKLHFEWFCSIDEKNHCKGKMMF